YPGRKGPLREGMRLPLYGSASGKAFRTGQLVCVENTEADRQDPEIYGTPEGARFYEIVLREGIPAGYFLPLFRTGRVMAVLQLKKSVGAPLDPHEAEFLSALGNQLSVAVANALEHSAVKDSLARLSIQHGYLQEEVLSNGDPSQIVGATEVWRQILSQVK